MQTMNKQERIQVLTDLIKINSINGNELEVATYLKALFAKHNIEAGIDAFGDKRANLIMELNPQASGPILGLTGHMDTVDLVNEAKWQSNPFEPKLDGDKLYGRGSADMKSGLAAEVTALIELVESGQVKGHVRFLATAGEEYGTPGANRLEEQNYAADLAALVVGEPTGGDIVYAHSGSLNYRIKSYGQAVHSSRPEEGKNAITGLVKFYVAEQELFNNAPKDLYLGKIKHSITVIEGGKQVNIIPAEAKLEGNIRPTKAFSNEEVIKSLKALVSKLNQAEATHLEFELIHNFYPVVTSPDDAFVKKGLAATTDAFANLRKPKLRIINGATDASVFVKRRPDLPVFILGPDKWELAHQINEYTTISSYLAVIEAYKNIILNFFE